MSESFSKGTHAVVGGQVCGKLEEILKSGD
jgi:hypothetical protein